MTAETELGEGEGVLHVFARLAEQAPEHPFLSIDGECLTRRQFLERVSLWAGALARQGIGEGDQVMLIAPNGLVWCVAFWATVSRGAVPVPLDPQTGAWEIECLLATLEVKLCLAWSRFRAADIAANLVRASAARPKPPAVVCLDQDVAGTIGCEEFLRGAPALPVPSRRVSSDERLMFACTSGTTGNPKIIIVPHVGFLRAQIDMARTLGLTSDDCMLLGMPLFHQGGFGMGLQTLVAGGQAVYLSRFEPQSFLDTIQTHRVTAVQLSATLAKLLLSHPELDQFDLSSLRLAYFAGEVLPDEVAAQFWHVRQIRVVNVIGSSETATMVMWDSARDAHRSASEFSPLPYTAVHVGDWGGSSSGSGQPGTLWVSTDALLWGYHGNPAETERRLTFRGGMRWFDTQDLVLALPDGYVRFVGRVKRAIKRGPNLVHPEEVESFLLTHKDIAAVALVREDHELYGDSIVAWVQPAPLAQLSRGELLAFCRGKIAAYKIPDRFVIVEQLPVDIGKVQYKRIRANETLP
jgi:acyl-CoA synthetase (AMP-forming)/AMP-acid ligase II